jgi:hypothetical protein
MNVESAVRESLEVMAGELAIHRGKVISLLCSAGVAAESCDAWEARCLPSASPTPSC